MSYKGQTIGDLYAGGSADMKRARRDPETVPCKWCGEPTRMTGTKMCDRHWELESRIKHEPEMARRMLDTIAPSEEPDIYEKHHMQMLLDERTDD